MPGQLIPNFDVLTSLEYLIPLPLYEIQKPYQVYTHIADVPESEKTNLAFEKHENVLINDVRGHEDDFSLEENGFEYVTAPCEADLTSQDPVQMEAYLAETKAFLETKYEADRVFCYDFRIRRNMEMPMEGRVDLNDKFMHLRPVRQVHIDHTLEGGEKRIRAHMKEETGTLLGPQWRAQIINVWRPLKEPILDSPLALCDSRTVRSEDLVATDQVTRKLAGEIYYVKYNPEQRWHYLSNQKKDEVVVFKSYDSEAGVSFAPHVAFENPHAHADAPERESVEVRALVFYKKEADTTSG